jgi:CHRD domain
MEKVLIFIANLTIMKWIKLTAFATILLGILATFNSCEKAAEAKKTVLYEKKGIVMSGAQETPAITSPALGTLDVFYIKGTKTLSYTINWSGLTGNPVGMHVHGLAPTGFAAPVLQNISTTGLTASGSRSGTLLVDGVVIKEESLLSGLYYINIHTATFPGGEIRGQIVFQ